MLPFTAVKPLLHALDPETAHGVTVRALALGLGPRDPGPRAAGPLSQTVFGLAFDNPVGLAAGFDKNAEVPLAMLGLGFGFVEVGTITPRPQRGNPRPRMARWPRRQALINRLGFNNQGLEAAAGRLARLPRQRRPIGANIGKNKTTPDGQAARDYARCAARLAPLVDYLVVNVSSPNTPGLRALQDPGPLTEILTEVLRVATAPDRRCPVILKIAPDLAADDLDQIARVLGATGCDGLLVSNTTLARPDDLPKRLRGEAGGLSGPPLFDRSTAVLRAMADRLSGQVPLIGAGGVASGADAYAKIRAGASLVQLYTALAYQGPGLVPRIKAELSQLLARDGFARVADAVGADLG